MASGLSIPDESFDTDRREGAHRRASVHRIADGLREPLAAFAFWSAIVLPALYVPLLFHGIESVDGLAVFLGIFGLHVLALAGGQRHRRKAGA